MLFSSSTRWSENAMDERARLEEGGCPSPVSQASCGPAAPPLASMPEGPGPSHPLKGMAKEGLEQESQHHHQTSGWRWSAFALFRKCWNRGGGGWNLCSS